MPGNGSREVWISALDASGGDPTDFSTDYQIKAELVSGGGHTLLRSDETTAATAPYVAGYPYIINPLCPTVPSP